MRIGFNATCFNDRPSGANQRFAGIYRAVVINNPDIEFIVYEPADCRVGAWFGGAPNVTARRTPLPSTGRLRRTLSGLGYWRGALRKDKLDLFEVFHLPLVRAPDCPTLLTIHDARPVLPDVPAFKRALYGRVLRAALRDAHHVITVSETMRQEILCLEPRTVVTAIYNGIDPRIFEAVTPASAAQTRAKLALPERFVLAVGHLERRKNYLRLLGALARLRDEGETVGLVIVGNEGGEGGAIAARVRELDLQDRVLLLRGVSDAELADIYALSSLVAFPSTYEGFGIPVLEAMAARRPLVLSDIPVFRELTEGKATYFAPDDVEGMARTIRKTLLEPAVQAASIQYGEARIADFTFPALAAQVEQVYRILAEPPLSSLR